MTRRIVILPPAASEIVRAPGLEVLQPGERGFGHQGPDHEASG